MFALTRKRVILTALLASALVLPASALRAQTVSTYVGTQTATSKLGFLILDFNDPDPVGGGGIVPEVYTFGYYYEGNPSNRGLLDLLQSTLTDQEAQARGFNGGFDRVLTAFNGNPNFLFTDLLKFNNRVKTGSPGYWSLWQGQTATSLSFADFGPTQLLFSDTAQTTSTFQAAPWQGYRWVNDFNDPMLPAAPRAQFAAVAPSAAAPEPSTALLLLPIMMGMAARRRR